MPLLRFDPYASLSKTTNHFFKLTLPCFLEMCPLPLSQAIISCCDSPALVPLTSVACRTDECPFAPKPVSWQVLCPSRQHLVLSLLNSLSLLPVVGPLHLLLSSVEESLKTQSCLPSPLLLPPLPPPPPPPFFSLPWYHSELY